jgi:hypothetical protein
VDGSLSRTLTGVSLLVQNAHSIILVLQRDAALDESSKAGSLGWNSAAKLNGSLAVIILNRPRTNVYFVAKCL